MRRIRCAILTLTMCAVVVNAQAPSTANQATTERREVGPPVQRIGTMSDLMVYLIYPTSDAIFYISSRTPKTDAEWGELKAKALTLAESANLLMMPGRARDQSQWMKDAKSMLDAGAAAFRAASAKDVAALEALSEQLYESCVSCHKNYRPGYGKPRLGEHKEIREFREKNKSPRSP